jgi:type I restriction enzyme S subunit
MASEWSSASLLDHYDSKSGLSKPSKYFGSGFPFLSFKDVFYNYFTPDRLTQLVQSSDMERENGSIKRGDVFLTRTSETMNELGMSSVALKNYENATFNGFTKRLRPKPDCPIYPEFIGYYLRSPQFRSEMLSFSTMSTRASLNNEMIGRLTIPIPPFIEQKKIAWPLMSLEQKIQLNRQNNQTLEQMAQALFKTWFVDFHPVMHNALAAGNPIPDALQERAERRQQQLAKPDHKPLPDDIHQLFPSEFELTEALGWVPKGWEVGNLSEITTELRRGISPKYLNDGGVSVVNQKCIRNHEINYGLCRRNDPDLRKVNGRELQIGDVLINSTGVGTLGRIAQVNYLPELTVVDSHVTVVRPDKLIYPSYTFGQMMLSLESYIESLGEGSTGQTELSRKMVSEHKVLIPNLETLKIANEQFRALTKKFVVNSIEIKALASIRDTLLPKLISGELRLPSDTTEQKPNSN